MYLTARCKDIDKKLEDAKVMADEIRLLDSIPGIGMLSAVQLMSAIVDIKRFPTQGQFRSYFGMAPKVKDSGGKMHHGHITKIRFFGIDSRIRFLRGCLETYKAM